MHTVDLIGKTDQEIVAIIMSAGRMAEKWKTARKNLGLKNQFKAKEKDLSRFRREDKYPAKERKFKKSDRSEKRKFKKDRSSKKDNSKLEGIESAEIQ
jgi:hypothetical protein